MPGVGDGRPSYTPWTREMCVREGLVECQLLTPSWAGVSLAWWAYVCSYSPKMTSGHEFDSPASGMCMAD